MTKNVAEPTGVSVPATGDPAPDPRRTGLAAAVRYLPLLPVLAGVVWLLVASHTPFWAPVGYGAAFAWTVMVPGVILQRRLLGRRPLLAADLGYGGAIGLLYQLLGWAVCVGTGLGRLVLAWPLLVVVPAVLSRRRSGLPLRLPRYPERQPAAVSWILAVVFLWALRWFAALPMGTTLPDEANEWYKDEYFHLGLAGMFRHQVTPQVPTVAGEGLHYHWFVHAHMAAMSLASGVDLPVVVTRLYMVPLLAVLIWLFVAVLADLTASAWPGVLAAAMTLTAAGLRPQQWFSLSGLAPLALQSPSQNFSLIVLLLVLAMVLRWFRSGRLRAGEWTVLVVALIAGPGSKSSTLPVLFAGAAMALLAAVLLGRPGRRFRRAGRPVFLLGLVLIALLVTTPVLGGGGSGAHAQLFAVIRRTPQWGQVTGLTRDQQLFSHALVAPGVTSAQGMMFLLLILVSFVVGVLWLLPAAGLLLRSRSLAAWFLAGVGLGGFAAMMLIDHPGVSEVYFFAQGVVAWHVLAAWGAYRVVQRTTRVVDPVRLWLTVLGAAVAGWAFLALVRLVVAAPADDGQDVGRLALSLLPVVVLAAVTAWIMRRRLRRGAAPLLVLALNAFVLGAAVIPSTWPGPVSRGTLDSIAVTADETQAARWLRDTTSPGQVVATNVHCLGLQQGAGCDARAFWVSGFSERPVLIEGWGYTDQAQRAAGQDGLTFTRVPFADPGLFALNESAFYHPRNGTMPDLRAHGVAWLFADSHRRAQPLSKDIGRYATQVYRNPDVTIYRIEKP